MEGVKKVFADRLEKRLNHFFPSWRPSIEIFTSLRPTLSARPPEDPVGCDQSRLANNKSIFLLSLLFLRKVFGGINSEPSERFNAAACSLRRQLFIFSFFLSLKFPLKGPISIGNPAVVKSGAEITCSDTAARRAVIWHRIRRRRRRANRSSSGFWLL